MDPFALGGAKGRAFHSELLPFELPQSNDNRRRPGDTRNAGRAVVDQKGKPAGGGGT
jgi:hypothetical protein